MALSKTLKKVSAKLINKFGNDLVLTKITEGAYDPSLGASATAPVIVTTKGIDEDYISEHSHSGDMKITFVSDTEIDAHDKCTYRGADRVIKSIQQVGMENLTIIYQIIVSGDAKEQV